MRPNLLQNRSDDATVLTQQGDHQVLSVNALVLMVHRDVLCRLKGFLCFVC